MILLGCVFWAQQGAQYVALKVMTRNTLADQSAVRKEIAVWKDINKIADSCPHLLPLLDIREITGATVLVMPLLSADLLSMTMHRRESSFSEDEATHYTKQILAALDSLHRHDIAHLDVKPENLALNAQNELVLFDYGLSVRRPEGLDWPLEWGQGTFIGTPYFVSPEIISRGHYSPAADIWAAGVVSYVLLAGVYPFATNEAIQRGHLHLPRGLQLSRECVHFLKACFEHDPCRRPTAARLTLHPWLAGGIA